MRNATKSEKQTEKDITNMRMRTERMIKNRQLENRVQRNYKNYFCYAIKLDLFLNYSIKCEKELIDTNIMLLNYCHIVLREKLTVLVVLLSN